ncbi:MAG: hypothetical protein K940chlam8_00403 [Chlamydiae bacterium]|nr:hypothetical protein [Chlamydiota bacterium]
MVLNLRVVSFNISGIGDLARTAEKFQKSTKIGKIATQIVQSTVKDMTDYSVAMRDYYRFLMTPFLEKLITEMRPDVFCLQELCKARFVNESEHQIFVDIFQKHGYSLCWEGDTAVVYRNKRFDLVKKAATTDPSEPAYYADLHLKRENRVVRFVSDHPSYSSGSESTSLTGNIKQINLDEINSPFMRLMQKVKSLISSFFGGNKAAGPESMATAPELIIYGLDANATRVMDDKTKEWQPERLQAFENAGFEANLEDNAPTLKYKVSQKVDHIYAKILSGGTLKMVHHIIKGLNDEGILDNPDVLPASDHLPLIYDITYSSEESFSSLIRVCFKSIFA